MRIFAAIVALCAAGAFAGLIVLKDNSHWRNGDRRHASRGAFRGALIALVMCCIAIGACICGAVSAHARPSPYPPVTQFVGDRYAATAQMGADVARAVKAKRSAQKRAPVARKPWRRVPVPRERPLASEPYRVEAPISIGEGVRREVVAVVDAIARPSRFISGRLICARNVNAALAARGIKGTGSAWAKSFLTWGRPSGPVPGAVAVYSRGGNPRNGHAAIVAFVRNGVPYVWNPSRHGWRLQAYRKPAISYRVPS